MPVKPCWRSDDTVFSSERIVSNNSSIRPGMSSRGALNVPCRRWTSSRSRLNSLSASMPTSASTRLEPALTDDSWTRLITPICADDDTCVPAHSSLDQGPPISTIRTVSPYFSPNNAMAPIFFASSMGNTLVSTGKSSWMAVFAMVSISSFCSSANDFVHEKSSRI